MPCALKVLESGGAGQCGNKVASEQSCAGRSCSHSWLFTTEMAGMIHARTVLDGPTTPSALLQNWRSEAKMLRSRRTSGRPDLQLQDTLTLPQFAARSCKSDGADRRLG